MDTHFAPPEKESATELATEIEIVWQRYPRRSGKFYNYSAKGYYIQICTPYLTNQSHAQFTMDGSTKDHDVECRFTE